MENKAGLTKPAGCHSCRHSFATHLLERGQDIRTIRKLMSHSNLNTTMIDTHVLKRGSMGVISPADLLWQPLDVDIGSDNHCSLCTRLPKSGCGN